MSTKMPMSSTIRISKSDVISGRMYLRLVNDFKTYDARRKQYIERLREHIGFLSEEHPEREAFYKDSDREKRLRMRLEELTAVNARLYRRTVELENRLGSLVARLDRMENDLHDN